MSIDGNRCFSLGDFERVDVTLPSCIAGIDSAKSAIALAKENAELNGFQSIEFEATDIESYMKSAQQRGQQWDVVILGTSSYSDHTPRHILMCWKLKINGAQSRLVMTNLIAHEHGIRLKIWTARVLERTHWPMTAIRCQRSILDVLPILQCSASILTCVQLEAIEQCWLYVLLHSCFHHDWTKLITHAQK